MAFCNAAIASEIDSNYDLKLVHNALASGAYFVARVSKPALVCDIEDVGFVVRDCLLLLHTEVNYWYLFQKELSGTYVSNIMNGNVGALNIDKCRSKLNDDDRLLMGGSYSGNRTGSNIKSCFNSGNGVIDYQSPPGRWPANVLLQHHCSCTDISCHSTCVIHRLDQKSGNRPGASRFYSRFTNDAQLYQWLVTLITPQHNAKLLNVTNTSIISEICRHLAIQEEVITQS